jgi:hypothetical protein
MQLRAERFIESILAVPSVGVAVRCSISGAMAPRREISAPHFGELAALLLLQ